MHRIIWNVVQPQSGSSLAIDFKAKAFPSEGVDLYDFLPDVSEILYQSVSGFQYNGNDTYNSVLSSEAQAGKIVVNTFTDDCYYFKLNAN